MEELIPRSVENKGKAVAANVISLRCPDCSHAGTFEPIETIQDLHIQQYLQETISSQSTGKWMNWLFGQRKCPRPECRAHVFVVIEHDELIASYPAERIDFDKEGIPEGIVGTLEEAITCHSERCYIASAIMVRRTLEEICGDRNANGDNLWERIRNLKNSVVISEGLMEGMGSLILLGNDAAHIESRTFEKISKEEVQLSIEITKEILKAVYQEKNLVERLNNLKRRKQ